MDTSGMIKQLSYLGNWILDNADKSLAIRNQKWI